jgi:ATP-dependent DNA ligase
MKIDTFKYFYPERPVLLSVDQPLFQALSDDEKWVAEPKFNGCRLQLHYRSASWEFWNRHGERMSYSPNREMGDELDRLAKDLKSGYYLFDGELRHGKVTGVQHLIMLYDVLIWDSTLMIGKPFHSRRNLLEKLPVSNVVSIITQHASDFMNLFQSITKEPEIEGLVIKNLLGILNLGRTAALNSKWMFKVRRPNNSYRF